VTGAARPDGGNAPLGARPPQSPWPDIACRYLLPLSQAETAAALRVGGGIGKSTLSPALERLRGSWASLAGWSASCTPSGSGWPATREVTAAFAPRLRPRGTRAVAALAVLVAAGLAASRLPAQTPQRVTLKPREADPGSASGL